MNYEQYSDSSNNNANPDWDFTKENSEIDKKAYADEEVQEVPAGELNPLPEGAGAGIDDAGLAEAPKSDLNPTPSDAAPELYADVATYPESEPINPTPDSLDSDTIFDNTEKPSSDLNPLPEKKDDEGPEEGANFNFH